MDQDAKGSTLFVDLAAKRTYPTPEPCNSRKALLGDNLQICCWLDGMVSSRKSERAVGASFASRAVSEDDAIRIASLVSVGLNKGECLY